MQKTNNPTMAESFKAAQGRGEQAKQPEAPEGSTYGGPDYPSLLGGSLLGDIVNDVTAEYHAVFKNILERASHNPVVKAMDALVLNGDVNQLALNSILVTYKVENKVAVFTLSIDSETNATNNRQVTVYNQQIEEEITTSDLIDDNLWHVTKNYLANVHGTDVTFIDVGTMIVPDSLEVELDAKAFQSILNNAASALTHVMSHVTGKVPPTITVANILKANDGNGSNNQFRSNMFFHAGMSTDIIGRPVRSDVAISLASVNVNNQSLSANSKMALTNVEAFVDLVPTPALTSTIGNMYQPQNYGYGQPQPQGAYYMPRIVISSNRARCGNTMETQLLGLVTVGMLAENRNYVAVFDQQNVGKNEWKDLGAVGYEVDLFGVRQPGTPSDAPLEKMDTRTAEFDQRALHDLTNFIFTPAPALAMDLEANGSESWIQRKFKAAAQGDTNAINFINNSANILTNGQMANYWNGANPMMPGAGTKVHTGYYFDDKQAKRDIRELDYLAMVNLMGDKDLNLCRMYMDTYLQVQIEEPIRLRDRLNIMRKVLGDNLVITGEASREMVNPEFVKALATAVAASGLFIQPEGIVNQTVGGPRGTMDPTQYMLGNNVSGGIFRHQQPTGPGYQARTSNRGHWG